MKKIVLFCLVVVFGVAALNSSARALDTLDNWYAYYYLDKNPAGVPAFLKRMQKDGKLDASPDNVASAEGFLSIVFAQNPDKVEEWKKSQPFSGKTQEVIDVAAKGPIKPEALTFASAEDLNKAWGAYYASGDTAYIARVVSVLDPAAHPTGNVKTDEELRGQAIFSLGANMTQHESVERFLQAESDKRSDSDAVGNALKNILSNVRHQRAAREFPDRNGEFSAVMLVVDPATFTKELKNASGALMRVKQEHRARPGDKRGIVIFFAGMQLSKEDYKADVAFDVKLTDPDGKVYQDDKDLVGIKQRVPTRFGIFNPQNVVFITFDKKDTKGTYKISAVVKDNVSGKTIPITSQIVLKK